MMAAPPPPPGVPPGMQTPQGKMSHYGMHPQASPGLEDDFQHLGMIADLLDDSPGVVVFLSRRRGAHPTIARRATSEETRAVP